ncbi:MAG: hypothetical protein IJH75_04260 [Mogibacterium sp.]|nr:hypothetical protein [Mogibacterium sp.]
MQKFNNNRISRLGAAVLSGLLVAGTVLMTTPQMPVLAETSAEQAVENEFPGLTEASPEKSKSETVYAVLDANGKTTEITVDEWLQNEEKADKLRDYSDLTDITNTSGNETFEQKGKDIVWNANGSDIHYQGTYEGELPVKVGITYRLNGKEVSAEEIAGQEGDVEIAFDYTVLQTDHVSGYTLTHPYMIVSAVVLNNDDFSEIEVVNGRAVNDGSSTACVGLAMPGMNRNLGISEADFDIPSYVTIKAHTTDFNIEGTYTIATSGLFDDMDTDDLDDAADKLSDLESALDKLSDASDKLRKGSRELAGGAEELRDGVTLLANQVPLLVGYISQLASGASDLSDGANQLSSGAQQISDAIENQLAPGAQQLDGGLAQAGEGAKQLDEGLGQLNDSMDSLTAGAEQLKNGTGNLKSQAETIVSSINDIAEGTEGLQSGIDQLAAAGTQAQQAVDGAKTAIDSVGAIGSYSADTSAIDAAFDAAIAAAQDDESKASLESARSAAKAALQDQVDDLNGKVSSYNSAVSTAQSAANQASQAVSGLNGGLSSLSDSAAALSGGASALNDAVQGDGTEENPGFVAGVDALDQGASGLFSGAQQAAGGVGSLKEGSSALKENLYGTETQKVDEDGNPVYDEDGNPVMETQTGAIKAGSEALVTGICGTDEEPGLAGSVKNGLVSGANDLASGAAELKQGLQALRDQSGALPGGASQLADGSSALAEGADELAAGIAKFDKDGIKKLVSSLSDTEIDDIADRLSATIDAGKTGSFVGGKLDSTTGESKIIFKTGEVKKAKNSDE